MNGQNESQQEVSCTRVFQIGGVRLVEEASMKGKTNAEIQQMLKPLYPQVENATLRERFDEASGLTLIEFIPRPGRKG